MEKLGITKSLTSGYHPQSNGQVGRASQEIGLFLWTFLSENQGDWAWYLHWGEYAQNSLCHSTTQLKPFWYVLGYLHWFRGMPQSLNHPLLTTGSIIANRSGNQYLQQVANIQKWFSDWLRSKAPQFSQGDQVWFSTKDIRHLSGCRKVTAQAVQDPESDQPIN